ncbi:glycoside hydrolase family 93 protein [Xylaria palmicola]|nr:glycoside hydrolase family 93 protein [Xylaria palmicola]
MRRSILGAALTALWSTAHAHAAGARGARGVQALASTTVFTPPSNYTDPRVLYARTVQLPNNDLLATWENYSPEPPPVYFPVYRSSDAGATWREVARVHDAGYGHGLRYQPFLYVLPERFAGLAAGTVLLAGSSIPTDLSSTQLDLYASTDGGRTWAFLSHVAAGGVAVPNNGLTPVWEPFLLLHRGRLLYYYSDQRDPAHGQKLVHQATTDLRTWGPVVDDVAYPTYTDRPGMPTVASLPGGRFIYAYEYGGGPNPDPDASGYTFPVYYRIAADPAAFAAAPHRLLRTRDGRVPNGSPYVVWTPAGGPNGTIVVSSGCCSDIYVNKALGADDAWEAVSTPEGASYTRSLRVFQEDSRYVLISGAGHLPPSTTNKVTVSVVKID